MAEISANISVPVVEEAVYVSLIGPLLGYYARIPYANNSIEASWICNNSKLKSLWCSTYTREAAEKAIEEYGGQFIELYADGLNFDMYELEQLREQIKGADSVQVKL